MSFATISASCRRTLAAVLRLNEIAYNDRWSHRLLGVGASNSPSSRLAARPPARSLVASARAGHRTGAHPARGELVKLIRDRLVAERAVHRLRVDCGPTAKRPVATAGLLQPDIWRSERGIKVAAAWPAHFRLTAKGQSLTGTSRRSGRRRTGSSRRPSDWRRAGEHRGEVLAVLLTGSRNHRGGMPMQFAGDDVLLEVAVLFLVGQVADELAVRDEERVGLRRSAPRAASRGRWPRTHGR